MADASVRRSFRRVQLACTPCHRAKLKCNREVVCDQCSKRSRVSQCVYTEQGLRFNTARQNAASMRAKLDRLEKLFVHLKGDSNSKVQLPDFFGQAHHDEGGAPCSSPCLKVTSFSRPAGNTYHISPSHWESIMDDIADVKAYFEMEDCLESLDSYESFEPGGSASGIQPYFNVSVIPTKEDLLLLLPSKLDTDRLVGSWYNGIDPLRLIVHAPSFQIDYQLFWQDPASVDMQWLAMLFAIITAGAEISGQIRDDAATLVMADRLRITTVHAINMADCTTIKKWLLETLLIHARAYQIRNQETDVHVCSLLGFCTRLAIMAGFHLDPSRHSAISAHTCEMRRRIWACVCEQDVIGSYQRGAFSAIFRTKSDNVPPANLLDTDFSREAVPAPRSKEDYTPALHQAHCSGLIDVFGDIVHASENLGTPIQADTDALYCRLLQARASWPKVLCLTPFDQAFMDSNELILNRFNLKFLFLKAVCVLYRDYLGTPGIEQERCLAAAEELVRNQMSMLEHTQPGSKLASSTVFIKHHIHDFNLATMLLCLDMATVRTPADEPDPSDRRVCLRPVIIQACNLWLQTGVSSRRARHALNAVLKFVHQKQHDSPSDIGISSLIVEVDQVSADSLQPDSLYSPTISFFMNSLV
ncbi:hypothetical protein K431DRAFT_279648 [Polychaeton citri CBS 116435]|uniref:Zn(2)-C6 fungal-type domain-containing protein n=1 Tax=Polychaeton citri CBS 116435 TaxID=1314669 RepID=A0A9P4UJV5_9PEZI|nr:hypothetical protein K431DRAFT_279648 [Polychaeton citri CBS 116435]